MTTSVENGVRLALNDKLVPTTDVAPNTIPVTTVKPPVSAPPSHSLDADDEEEEEEEERASHMIELKSTLTDRLLRLPQDGSTILDPRDEATPDRWVRRNPSLVRLTGKHPFNCEPPLSSLMDHGFITPSPLHYVRNHGPVPKATWDSWSVEVVGEYLTRPCRLTMDDLVGTFRSQELPVTLVCAGNRRKEQNMVRQSVGFNWGAAGVSTAVWEGVPLRHVLIRCGVARKHRGLFVCFVGEEDLPGGSGSKYGTSIALEVAMDPSNDVLLAYMMNGEVLPPDHGFPLRLIIPGYIGGRMVKWLRRIEVTGQESQNFYHFKDNRVLPSHVHTSETADAEGWWFKPEHIINELNVNSAITSPCHDEILPINSLSTHKPYVIKGYAYSGGGKKVTRVEVTLDGGETWMLCDLDHPEKPNDYGKYWCWCFWSVRVEIADLVATKEIAVRAWDQTHNTQPEKLIWNLMGMMNNCWFRVKVHVCRPNRGEIGLVFGHPTQPGNNSGGWMAPRKHMESTENQTPNKSISTPFMNTTNKYSMSDVGKHTSRDSPWIIVHGGVYDCTTFLEEHPGGADSILINAGTDCTEEFDAIHSDKAKAMLETYRIGELIATGYTSDTTVNGTSNAPYIATINEGTTASSNSRSPALVDRVKIQCRLVSKTTVSHDVRMFRFALPSDGQLLGVSIGKHIFLGANINGKLCMRPYTPTSKVDEVGCFDLVVKVYGKGIRHPKGGIMSQYLDSLPIGSMVDVKGPIGHIEYTGRGNFLVRGKPKSATRLAMIAGGTGITPMYQMMQAVLSDLEDKTEMWLVYANHTEDDILLRRELDRWAREHSHRLRVWYVIAEASEGWAYSVGKVCEEVLREHVPAWSGGTLALACGPPPMIEFAVRPNLEKLGYDLDNSVLIF